MPTYAVGIMPLIRKLCSNVKQIWYADDSVVVGKLKEIREWWNKLNEVGPMYGYFPKASKTKLLIKEKYLDSAKSAFLDTDIEVLSDG